MTLTHLMRLLLICAVINNVYAVTDDENEKAIKVWEDRIQHTDLDADEVNFPLFLHTNNDETNADDIIETDRFENDKIETHEDLNDFNRISLHSNGSIITFFHKVTTNNVTKEGVTKIPSTQVLPLIRTVLGSISEEHLTILGLGAVLPIMMMILPFAAMAVIVPIFLVIGIAMFGVVTSSFFFMPLALFGFGLYAATDFDFFSEKTSSFDEFENFPNMEEIGAIGEKIEKAVEKVENMPDDESPIEINSNNDVPRTFF